MPQTRPPNYPTFESRKDLGAKTQASGRRPAMAPPAAASAAASRPKVAVRPEVVKVVCVLAMAHAGATLLWLVASAVMVLASGKPVDPTIAVAKSDGFLFTWTLGTAAVSFALAMLLLFAAMSLWSMKSWARRAMMFWAMAWIFLNVAALFVNVKYLYPQMGTVSVDHATLAKTAQLFSSVFLGVAWPVALIALFQTKKIKRAFVEAASASSLL